MRAPLRAPLKNQSNLHVRAIVGRPQPAYNEDTRRPSLGLKRL